MRTVKDFSFFTPTRVLFGKGIANSLLDEIKALKASRPLLITDRGLGKSQIVENMRESLIAGGLAVEVFADIQENPRDTSCHKGADMARSHSADAIVAVGGGSPMDAAKAISILATNTGKVHDYFGFDKVREKGLPLITVPTTAGTASEVTMWAVITDTTGPHNVKDAIGSSLICPQVALVDPLLTLSLPPGLTASTGMDALTHAIEAYTSVLANPFSDAFAISAVKYISEYLPQAFGHGDNVEAREYMMLGSLMAGVAFSNSDTGAVHSLAEAIGGIYDVPHGAANAMFLPFVMEFNIPACPSRHADVGRFMGEGTGSLNNLSSALESVEAVRALSNALEIPSLRDVGVLEKDFDLISTLSMANLGTPDNARKMTKEGFLRIVQRAYSQGV